MQRKFGIVLSACVLAAGMGTTALAQNSGVIGSPSKGPVSEGPPPGATPSARSPGMQGSGHLGTPSKGPVSEGPPPGATPK
jgi:hypothetical protein